MLVTKRGMNVRCTVYCGHFGIQQNGCKLGVRERQVNGRVGREHCGGEDWHLRRESAVNSGASCSGNLVGMTRPARSGHEP